MSNQQNFKNLTREDLENYKDVVREKSNGIMSEEEVNFAKTVIDNTEVIDLTKKEEQNPNAPKKDKNKCYNTKSILPVPDPYTKLLMETTSNEKLGKKWIEGFFMEAPDSDPYFVTPDLIKVSNVTRWMYHPIDQVVN